MERALFGASGFFSQEAFITGHRGIEQVRVGRHKETNLEIVDIWYNPWKVSYYELLELFFDLHDPVSREGQPNNNQSFIFFSDKNQYALAKKKKNDLVHTYKNKIVTKITPANEWIHNLKEIQSIS